MPRFKCSSCNAGYYSAASLASLNDDRCRACGSPVELARTSTAAQPLADRVGHLIARREVARAQARVNAERLVGEGAGVGAPL